MIIFLISNSLRIRALIFESQPNSTVTARSENYVFYPVKCKDHTCLTWI